eukprot:11156544-Lingulodinium_polyedra.AAC.1
MGAGRDGSLCARDCARDLVRRWLGRVGFALRAVGRRAAGIRRASPSRGLAIGLGGPRRVGLRHPLP